MLRYGSAGKIPVEELRAASDRQKSDPQHWRLRDQTEPGGVYAPCEMACAIDELCTVWKHVPARFLVGALPVHMLHILSIEVIGY